MKFARRQPKRPNVELTSMLDVVFLLLIFFMVSTRFETLSEVPIALPQIGEPAAPRTGEATRVQLRANGVASIDGEEVSVDALVERLGEAKKIVLAADEAVQHGVFMEVLTSLRALPLSSVQVEVRSSP